MYAIKTSNTRDIELYNKIIEKRMSNYSLILTNCINPPENTSILMEVNKLTDIIIRNDIKTINEKQIYIQENILDIPMFIIEDKHNYRILTSKSTGGMIIGPKGKWAKKLYNIFNVKTINVISSYNTKQLNIDYICKMKAHNILILKNNDQYLIMNIDLFI